MGFLGTDHIQRARKLVVERASPERPHPHVLQPGLSQEEDDVASMEAASGCLPAAESENAHQF